MATTTAPAVITANPAPQSNIHGILSACDIFQRKSDGKDIVVMKVTLQSGRMIDIITDPLFFIKQFPHAVADGNRFVVIGEDKVKRQLPELGNAVSLAVQTSIANVTTYTEKDDRGNETIKLHTKSTTSLVKALYMNDTTKARVEKVVAINMLGFEVTQDNVFALMDEAVQL